MAKLRELQDKRGRLIAEMRTMIDGDQTLSAEQEARYNEMFNEADTLKRQIDRIGQVASLEEEIRGREPHPGGGAPAGGTARQVRAIDDVSHRYRLVRGAAGFEAAEARATAEYHENVARYLATGEVRALSAASGPDGGYTIAPQMAQDLIQAIDDQVAIRGLATVTALATGQSLGKVSLDSDPADADWTPELGTGNEDTAMAFGQREFKPYPLAKRVKVSNKIIRASGFDVVAILLQRLAYKFAVTEEKAFMTGSGVNQPLGLFTVSSDGIPASRDVATGNTSTAPGYDGLVNAKYALKAGYWRRARWVFCRDAVAAISKLKDTANLPIWQPSVQMGQPDMLLGIPVIVNEYVPNTMTTGQYVGAIGDFSYFHIVDALDMGIQRLNELYSETNQTGFIARRETDAMPVLAEAFARVKLA